ncbi:MAG: ribulose-phosphate 3-epimerase [Acidobacteriia bacterium]|nr:ribulose-phosphate 3-epimerase [Terriglobia bacterium]
MALIAPSLLAADFARLGAALEVIKAAGAAMVHVDVMDGHFVPDLTVGQPVIQSLRKATELLLDVHLLVERPERYAEEFVAAGADQLAVHAEATPNLHRVLENIRARGAKAGVALNPATPVETLADVLEEIDFLSILSADPAIPEGPFLPRSVSKIRAADRMRHEQRLDFAIEVEGGIGPQQVEELIVAGADILVAGSAIFSTEDPTTRLQEMVRQASSFRRTSRVLRT